MPEHRWPEAPDVPDAESRPQSGCSSPDFEPVIVPPRVRCKHGLYGCERCGTSDRTDTMHRTINGRGVVARLRRTR